jgi:hypothetical protein
MTHAHLSIRAGSDFFMKNTWTNSLISWYDIQSKISSTWRRTKRDRRGKINFNQVRYNCDHTNGLDDPQTEAPLQKHNSAAMK